MELIMDCCKKYNTFGHSQIRERQKIRFRTQSSDCENIKNHKKLSPKWTMPVNNVISVWLFFQAFQELLKNGSQDCIFGAKTTDNDYLDNSYQKSS